MSSSRWLEKFGRIRWNMKNLHHPKKQTCSRNNLFLTQYYNRKGKKICISAIPQISQESHDCGKLSGVKIFLVQVTVEKWPQDHDFSQKVLLVGTPIYGH